VSDGKLQGTCSVCLRVIQLRGQSPIRHGFRAIGVQHGAHTGYHTGPCGGASYPHLGISTEGTAWALAGARRELAKTEGMLADLAGHPDLIWYPRLSGSYNKVRGGLPDMARPVTLRPGADIPYSSDGRPTYAGELKRRVAIAESQKRELERMIDAYEKVLATWSPEKYPVTGAATKIETTHLAIERRHPRYEKPWMGVTCRFTRPGHASDKLAKTTDMARVTCKACRKAIGLPAS